FLRVFVRELVQVFIWNSNDISIGYANHNVLVAIAQGQASIRLLSFCVCEFASGKAGLFSNTEAIESEQENCDYGNQSFHGHVPRFHVLSSRSIAMNFGWT